MPRGRPRPALVLTTVERETLDRWARAARSSQALAKRALIVLACADGHSNAQVAVALGTTPQTVGKWRKRFVEERLQGLADAPRSGAPRSVPAGDVEWLLALTLFARPRSSPRWSARSMGEVCGMSQSSVLRAWRGLGLRPGSIQSAQRRNEARARAWFERLLGLYSDRRQRARVRAHCVEGLAALRDWLSEHHSSSTADPRVELVLFQCGSAAEDYARDWQSTRARFGLHIAPRGSLWFETFSRWFSTELTREGAAATARISGRVVEAMASGDGFAGGTGVYAFSAAGERAIRAIAFL